MKLHKIFLKAINEIEFIRACNNFDYANKVIDDDFLTDQSYGDVWKELKDSVACVMIYERHKEISRQLKKQKASRKK